MKLFSNVSVLGVNLIVLVLSCFLFQTEAHSGHLLKSVHIYTGTFHRVNMPSIQQCLGISSHFTLLSLLSLDKLK